MYFSMITSLSALENIDSVIKKSRFVSGEFSFDSGTGDIIFFLIFFFRLFILLFKGFK